jgi:hypothetical protein
MDEDLLCANVLGAGVAALDASPTRVASAEWVITPSAPAAPDVRCDIAAVASDLDAAGESETTTVEDEPVIVFCAETSPAAVSPRIDRTATTTPARHMRNLRAFHPRARTLPVA